MRLHHGAHIYSVILLLARNSTKDSNGQYNLVIYHMKIISQPQFDLRAHRLWIETSYE
jgi:hypothetical protein